MTEQSNGNLSLRTIWLLIAVAVAAMIGVFASMATSLAIRDLQASQLIDQLKALAAQNVRDETKWHPEVRLTEICLCR